MWLLDHPNAHLMINRDNIVTGIELRRDCGDEITLKIDIGDAA